MTASLALGLVTILGTAPVEGLPQVRIDPPVRTPSAVLFQVPAGERLVDAAGIPPVAESVSGVDGRGSTVLFAPPRLEPGEEATQPRVRVVCGLTIVEADPSIDPTMAVQIPATHATFATPVLTPSICQD